MYAATPSCSKDPLHVACLKNAVYKFLTSYIHVLRTFLLHRWWQRGCLGIDDGVDEVIPPVPGHLQGRVTVLVLYGHLCTAAAKYYYNYA